MRIIFLHKKKPPSPVKSSQPLSSSITPKTSHDIKGAKSVDDGAKI